MNNISQLIYDTYKGNIPTKYAAMDKTAREDGIRTQILGVMGLERFERKAFRQAFRSKSAEVFNIIEDLADQVMVDGEYQKTAFYQQFCEVKNLSLGDKNEFYVEGKNQLEVSEFSGSHFDLKRRRMDVGQKFSVEMRDFGIKIYEELERIMSGRTDFAQLVTFIIEAIDRKLAEIGQATFVAAVAKLPTEVTFSGTYSEATILEKLAHVEASNGVKPTLVGTRTAIRKLQGVSDIVISNDMANTINNAGILPVWLGYECLELAQGHKIGNFEWTMPTNEIFALVNGSKLVKICLEGEAMVKEVKDKENSDLTEEYALIFKAGSAVAFSNLIGHITLV